MNGRTREGASEQEKIYRTFRLLLLTLNRVGSCWRTLAGPRLAFIERGQPLTAAVLLPKSMNYNEYNSHGRNDGVGKGRKKEGAEGKGSRMRYWTCIVLCCVGWGHTHIHTYILTIIFMIIVMMLMKRITTAININNQILTQTSPYFTFSLSLSLRVFLS